MKITKRQLRQLIQEAYTETLKEQDNPTVTFDVLNKILDDRFEAMRHEIMDAIHEEIKMHDSFQHGVDRDY